MKSRIKIQIIPTRLGCWSVWIDGWRIIKSTRDPLSEIAQRLLAAGHKREARITMTRTPDGPCRMASTIGNAATAAMPSSGDKPFRAPAWTPLHFNGGTQ